MKTLIFLILISLDSNSNAVTENEYQSTQNRIIHPKIIEISQGMTYDGKIGFIYEDYYLLVEGNLAILVRGLYEIDLNLAEEYLLIDSAELKMKKRETISRGLLDE